MRNACATSTIFLFRFLAFFGALPSGETNQTDNFVDVGHDSLNDNWYRYIFHFSQEFGQGCFCLALLIGVYGPSNAAGITAIPSGRR